MSNTPEGEWQFTSEPVHPDDWIRHPARIKELEAENEKMRAEVERWKREFDRMHDEREAAETDIEKLRGELSEAVNCSVEKTSPPLSRASEVGSAPDIKRRRGAGT